MKERFVDKYGQNRRWVLIGSLTVLIIAVFVGGYVFLKRDRLPSPAQRKTVPARLPRMANLPPKAIPKPEPPAPSYPPDAPVLEQARKALREGIDPSSAVALAKSFPDRPESPDAAFLLFEYAAEQGNAEAALAAGKFYDPAYKGPSGTIRKNPETAYEWYREALKGGVEEARDRLAELRQWLEEHRAQESGNVRDLLNRWQ